MTQPTPTVADTDAPVTEPPFDPALVEELLRQLDKTVRSHQLYLHNNPTYLKQLETMRGAFAPVWSQTESLTLQVSDASFTWSGRVVHEPAEKAADSIPWTLYKDGLRELTITPGFEGEELERFLEIIPRVRKALPHEDDLLTILWEQEFVHLTYRYVDLSQEQGAPIDASAEPGRWPVTAGEVVESPQDAIAEARAEQEQRGKPGEGGAEEELKESPSGIVRMEDFDSTLYFLDADEVKYLHDELGAEYQSDLRRRVLDILLDIFELQTDPLVRKEIAQNIDVLTLHLLAGRQFANVAHLLREIGMVLQRARDLPPDVKARLAELSGRLSVPEALSQLLQAMDESEALPPQEDLAQLFAELRPQALGTVFAWLSQSRNARLRPLLESAADRLASSNTGEVVKLIQSADGPVALEAVRRAGSLKTAAAVPPLTKVLGEPFRDLRMAAVTALVEIGTAGALQGLEKALEDTDRDVRLAALKALTLRAHKPVLPRVTQLVKAREVRDADRTERLAVFELFGAVCGDGGVAFLDELLNGKGGLFGRKEDPEMRACAAVALGKVGTPRARQALEKAMGEKDVIVRNAVNRAMRGGGA